MYYLRYVLSMTSKLTLISLLVLLALGLGCKKDQVPCTTCPTGSSNCEDIQNVKHFFYFKVGSWWVYEEENSGARDSVYVTIASENPNNYDFNVEVYSTYQDYYYRFWPEYYPVNGCPQNGKICKRCLIVKRSKYKPGDFVAEGRCFLFIPLEGDSQGVYYNGFPENRIYIEEVNDSLQLINLTFGRSISVYENFTLMEGKQQTRHTFSEDVGLVRKELLDSNRVWNLVDYHIEI